MNGQAITLTQAYAHLHDNAEGLLDRPRELRLLLVDREVPQAALAGLAPLTTLAPLVRAGRLQGLLLRLDPEDQRRLELTLLYPPPAPGAALLTRTITVSAKSSSLDFPLAPRGERVRVRGEKPAFNLSLHPQRVGGAFACPPEPQPESPAGPPSPVPSASVPPYSTSCPSPPSSWAGPPKPAPRFRSSGPRPGPWSRVMLLPSNASPLLAPSMQPKPSRPHPDWTPMPRPNQTSVRLQASLKHLQRVVVRSHLAVAVFAGKKCHTFILEGGEWKVIIEIPTAFSFPSSRCNAP